MTGDNINVAEVTRQLLDLVMKLPGSERVRLLKKLNPEALPEAPVEDEDSAISMTTTALIDAAMKLNIEKRCQLLGELKAISGSSARKYSRIDFFSPIQYVINGRLSNGYIKNISVSGLFLQDLHYKGPPLKSGTPVTMIFDHPHTGKHIKIQGEIIRITKTGLGIKFYEKI